MRQELICTKFMPLSRGSLRGSASITFPAWRLTIHDISLHASNGKRWASPPSKPLIKDGIAVRGDDGKILDAAIFDLDGRDVRDRFSEGVWAAVERFAPDKVSAA